MPSYNMPDSCPDYIFDIYHDPDPESNVHNCELKKQEELVHFFEGILQHLYGKEKDLDLENLEYCLEEVASILEMKIPNTPLTIERKNSIVSWWLEYNNQYNKDLSKKLL